MYQGYGLADNDGRKIFVDGGVPGDLVTVRVTHKKKDVFFGEIEKVIEKSAARCSSGCNAFGRCGGCDWLNIIREKQLEYKEAIISEIFYKQDTGTRLPIGFGKQDMHYRNKCFYPLKALNGKIIFGMFARYSHKIIEHNTCLIEPMVFDEIAQALCDHFMVTNTEIYDEATGQGNIRHIGFRQDPGTRDIQVIIVSRKHRMPFTNQLVRVLRDNFPQITAVIQNINPEMSNVILGSEDKVLFGDEYLKMQVYGKVFKVAYNSFFQVNIEVLDKVIEFLEDILPAGGAILDAYCGTGVLGICLAKSGQKVIGIDNSQAAIANAESNALANGLTEVDYQCGDTMTMLPDILAKEEIGTVIFDPPRKGLTKEIIEQIVSHKIPVVAYMSCNPMTQLRDIKQFSEAGYKIIYMQPFDMFPQTWHIENVVILKL
ncbi:MAG: 23S rRNA (uracil(1939)-C(5))-methyltransferase RlmD [Candidatus Cloacimonetes bacterium]|nr:23S rRNA (uracil(1939)-C(5))-methyltransferase RlmD [Candidatus Cloacimonadota bacterium]